jgi:hypothetical protein
MDALADAPEQHVSSALTAEAARWRDASISARMSPSSAGGAAGAETDALRRVMRPPPCPCIPVIVLRRFATSSAASRTGLSSVWT